MKKKKTFQSIGYSEETYFVEDVSWIQGLHKEFIEDQKQMEKAVGDSVFRWCVSVDLKVISNRPEVYLSPAAAFLVMHHPVIDYQVRTFNTHFRVDPNLYGLECYARTRAPC